MKNSFLGTGWTFPPAFSEGIRETILTQDEENIKDSLRAIVGTIPGERVMNVQFGCAVSNKLFASMNTTQQTQIKNMISQALNVYEPRITVEEVVLDMENLIDGLLKILIEYTVISTNQRNNLVYPYYLIEGTEAS